MSEAGKSKSKPQGEAPKPAGETAAGESVTTSSPQRPAKPLWKKRLRNGSIVLALVAVAGLWGYYWVGTNVYTGTVQRVYEKQDQYRVEFVTEKGEVHVFENTEQGFPHFKTATADMQAELHRLDKSNDLVEVTTWGFRSSVASAFPNVVEVELLLSAGARLRDRAERITDEVLRQLSTQGELRSPPEDVREDVVRAVERALAPPTED